MSSCIKEDWMFFDGIVQAITSDFKIKNEKKRAQGFGNCSLKAPGQISSRLSLSCITLKFGSFYLCDYIMQVYFFLPLIFF